MKKKYYETLLKEVTEQLENLQKQFNQISLFRGVLALLILLSIVVIVQYKSNLGYVFALLFIVGFVLLMNQHAKIKYELSYNKSQRAVLEKYLCRFSDDWHSFTEDGQEFLPEDTPQAKDLDLFGRNSLYQYICVANTPYGKSSLAKHLSNFQPTDKIASYQNGVKELAGLQEFSLKIQTLSNLITAEGKEYGHKNLEKFIKEAEELKPNISQPLKILMWTLPFLTLLFIILSLLGVKSEYSVTLSTIGIVLQLSITAWGYKKNTATLNPLLTFYRNIEIYKAIFSEIEQMDFNSDYLRELQSALRKNKGSVHGLKRLNSIGEAVKVRYNGIAYLICSALLMWDYHCVHSFEKWKRTYGTDIRKWLEATGELEALLSLTVLCNVKENYCFPVVNEGKTPQINTENVKHPLIKESQAVGNSVKLQAETCVITGSNMSGKTTFLRTVGTNLILAYAGGPVLADSFAASKMAVFTSMRVEDNVSKGISTFYAELLRIKNIVDYSKKSTPMIALIDEIFKGTNSADRIVGATEAIRKLSMPWMLTIVTTHDFELCNLEKDADINATNYHFSEFYVDNEIHFDYKMRPGRCQTTNAQHLLRMAGIL